MPTLFINGKFIRQQTTGVQRAAGQWLYALDHALHEDAREGRLDPAVDWVLLVPAGEGPLPRLNHIRTRAAGPVGLPLVLWEQFVLPVAAWGGVLLNLAGSAPVLLRNQVCTFHDAAVFDCPQAYSRPFRWWYRFLFRHLAVRARLLLTVSRFSQQRLLLCLPRGCRPLRVVPNGGGHFEPVLADDAVLSQFGLRSGGFVLVVGSANPNKNVARVVEAFHRLPPHPTRRLVLVGVPDNRVFSGHVHPGTAPGGDVVRAGAVPDAQIKALYRHAACLVFASLYEGYGLPAAEAMAQGCPVIAARRGALPEVCGDAALYVDPESVDDLTGAMSRVLGDEALRRRLADAGLQRALSLDWNIAAVALRGHLGAAGILPGARR
jgi:glycosyltransferase involved in cell wall biosynthesis